VPRSSRPSSAGVSTLPHTTGAAGAAEVCPRGVCQPVPARHILNGTRNFAILVGARRTGCHSGTGAAAYRACWRPCTKCLAAARNIRLSAIRLSAATPPALPEAVPHAAPPGTCCTGITSSAPTQRKCSAPHACNAGTQPSSPYPTGSFSPPPGRQRLAGRCRRRVRSCCDPTGRAEPRRVFLLSLQPDANSACFQFIQEVRRAARYSYHAAA
jgi:hypothetical protein